jgi:hypothetical protein
MEAPGSRPAGSTRLAEEHGPPVLELEPESAVAVDQPVMTAAQQEQVGEGGRPPSAQCSSAKSPAAMWVTALTIETCSVSSSDQTVPSRPAGLTRAADEEQREPSIAERWRASGGAG